MLHYVHQLVADFVCVLSGGGQVELFTWKPQSVIILWGFITTSETFHSPQLVIWSVVNMKILMSAALRSCRKVLADLLF